MKAALYKGIKNTESDNYRQRTVFFATVSLSFNVIYAIYNGFLGAWLSSAWFAAMSFYYILLGVMRFKAIKAEYKKKSETEMDCFKGKEISLLKSSGIILLFLTLALIGTAVLIDSNTKEYGEIAMITIATYTFYKIISAIINVVKVRKRNSPLCTVIRKISCADAVMSVLPMQSSMIMSFDQDNGMDFRLMTGLTGAGICIVIFYLGVSMIVSAHKLKS